jgi:hypothetical protein
LKVRKQGAWQEMKTEVRPVVDMTLPEELVDNLFGAGQADEVARLGIADRATYGEREQTSRPYWERPSTIFITAPTQREPDRSQHSANHTCITSVGTI